MHSEQPKARRRWRRWSLRGAMSLLTIVAVVMAWWSNKAIQQAKGVEQIRSLNGNVEFEARFAYADWMSHPALFHFFHVATNVEMDGWNWDRDGTDHPTLDVKTMVEAIQNLPSCHGLTLSFSGISKDQIVLLQPLSNQIETLIIRAGFYEDPKLTPAILGDLKNWTRLKSIDFQGNDRLPVDLSTLQTFPQLDTIRLGSTELAKKDFEALAKCKKLRTLSLYACSFQGKDIKPLSQLPPSFEELMLTNCSPRSYVESWTLNSDGTKRPRSPVEFYYQGGDPQFINWGEDRPDFPQEKYEAWKEDTLPGVLWFELFIS